MHAKLTYLGYPTCVVRLLLLCLSLQVHPNVLFVADVHAYAMDMAEVIGVLAGRYDPVRKVLHVEVKTELSRPLFRCSFYFLSRSNLPTSPTRVRSLKSRGDQPISPPPLPAWYFEVHDWIMTISTATTRWLSSNLFAAHVPRP